YDHTIPPRDAAVVRYGLRLPADAELPLAVEARLRQRRLTLEVQRASCAQARTPVGRAFRAQLLRRKGLALDGCAAQPIIDVATARAPLAGEPGAGEL